MDDTLIVSDVPYQTLWESSVKLYAAELGGLDTMVVYKTIREVADCYWGDPERHRQGRLDLLVHRRLIVKSALEKLGNPNEKLAYKIAGEYAAEREQHEVLVPLALETLENLRKQGIKLGLITNGGSEMQRAKIKKFNLEPLFDNILIEGEFGCGKPDERVFLHTLEKFNTKPSAAWMAGDDLNRDIAPCNGLGIFSLWVNVNGDGLAADAKIRPDRTIKTIAEIPKML
jgi:putative hydrolase of the HAD superfamily